MPRKNSATSGAGSASARNRGTASRPRSPPGTAIAAAHPMTAPSTMNGAPRAAARNIPRCPSSGLRADSDIWKAACASGTLTRNVPNQARISVGPVAIGSSRSGRWEGSSASAARPGSDSSAITPTTAITAKSRQFIV